MKLIRVSNLVFLQLWNFFPSVSPDSLTAFAPSDLAARNRELYNELRRSNVLDVLEPELGGSKTGLSALDVQLQSVEGAHYRCTMPGDEIEDNDDDENKDESEEVGTDMSSQQSTGKTRKKKKTDENEDLAALEGSCDTLSTGWWSYEWCHKRHVKQFHVDHVQGKVDPVWSLGNYKRRIVTNKTADEPRSIADYFEGGQHCDETGDGRRTKVNFRCCGDGAGDEGEDSTGGTKRKSAAAKRREEQKRERQKQRNSGATHRKDNAGRAVASFTSIREPETCSYEVLICSPLLCESDSKNVSALAMLEPLNGVCLSRHEGWWSYEMCYQRHVRQFHLVTGTDAKGKPTSHIEGEYILGESKGATMKRSFFPSNAASVDAHGMDDGAPGATVASLEVEYTDGTPCDLTETPRRSTLQFVCGATDKIESIVEDYTCHYKVVITTPHLCKHPAFIRTKPPTRAVTCRKEEEQNES